MSYKEALRDMIPVTKTQEYWWNSKKKRVFTLIHLQDLIISGIIYLANKGHRGEIYGGLFYWSDFNAKKTYEALQAS